MQGPPKFEPANTVPFKIGTPPPPPGTPNSFPEYDLSKPNVFRTNPVPPQINQAIVNNPNTVLADAIAGLPIVQTQVLHVSTEPGGGVENIPFIVANADAASVSATFWIEEVGYVSGVGLVLQYTQTVLLDFLGLSWPHVSVATLMKAF